MTNFFNFKGRLDQSRYFLFFVLYFLIGYLLNIGMHSTNNKFIAGIFIVFQITLSIKTIFISIQRLHDLGKSGYRFLLILIPLYNIYFQLILLLKKGEEAPNKFGENPLKLQ